MMKKDEEKRKKERKKNSKKKKERRQQYLKEHAQKEKEQAKQAEKNPYSVFAEKDVRRRSWTMILWFSQSNLPVITSRKAHYNNYHNLNNGRF